MKRIPAFQGYRLSFFQHLRTYAFTAFLILQGTTGKFFHPRGHHSSMFLLFAQLAVEVLGFSVYPRIFSW
jgi:hypothetical protein